MPRAGNLIDMAMDAQAWRRENLSQGPIGIPVDGVIGVRAAGQVATHSAAGARTVRYATLQGPWRLLEECAPGRMLRPGAIVAALPAFACPDGGRGYILTGTDRTTGEGFPVLTCRPSPEATRPFAVAARGRGADRTEVPVLAS